MINIKWKRFQERVIEYTTNFILEENKKDDSNSSLIIKSPTGSGKTLMMLQTIINVIQADRDRNQLVFLWLAPGKGNLEQQSMKKMIQFYPEYACGDVNGIMYNGFNAGTTYFINWEKIIKKGNKATSDNEIGNIHDAAESARINNLKFVVIVDEEHVNDTKKAYDFMHEHIKPYKEIRISATAKETKGKQYIEITDREVINSELITRSIFINPEVTTKDVLEDFDNEAFILIKTAEERRKEIVKAYEEIEPQYRINPLVLIQIPNKSGTKEIDPLLEYIQEDILQPMGVNIANGKLAIWLDKVKENLNGIEERNSSVEYLIFKQATATGWDCPRAKILVKLRNNMVEDFEIQTIGRIRRMPSQKHFDNDNIDNCFLYTFDAKFKDSVLMQSLGTEAVKLTLKPEFKNFMLPKEERNMNQSSYSENDWTKTLKLFYEFLVKKYGLSNNFMKNEIILADNGYNVDYIHIHDDMRQGQIQELNSDVEQTLIRKDVMYVYDNQVAHNDLTHAVDKLKNILGFNAKQLKDIIATLISTALGRGEYLTRYQIINIDNTHGRPPVFIINNVEKLASDLREFTSDVELLSNDDEFNTNSISRTNWYIPFQDLIKYDSKSAGKGILEKNVYSGYDKSMITPKNKIHSIPEYLFELFCDNNNNIKWYYKNGDKGKPYFSIIMQKLGVLKQQAFYPDYILEDNQGNIWIIEAKGGEDFAGNDKNIDDFIKQKYQALKNYEKWYNTQYEEKKYNLKTGFVRDKENELYICVDDEYEDNLNDPKWINIKQFFKS
ncbi:DEAD/DEAH box helicase family protein [Mycoplasma sp. Z244C]